MEKDPSLSNPDQQPPKKSEKVDHHRFHVPSSLRTIAYSWRRYKPKSPKGKISLSYAVIFVMLLVISCSGPANRGTNLVANTASTQIVTVTRQSGNATSQPTQGQAIRTPTPTWTPINASFPGLADTTDNIHIGLPFDFNTNPTAMAGKIDVVWGTNWARSLPGNIYSLFYLPYDRDEDTSNYLAAHPITWYNANHPDWVEYKCDRSTVAYEYGDQNSVPLDITNPAVVSYIEGTYLASALRSGSGYQGIGFDNLDFENAGDWTGQRCGHYTTHGTWVQQFNGTANDAAYRQSVLSWAQQMHTFMHIHFPNAIMAVNFSYDPNFSSDSNTLSNYVDFYIDEQGFTNGNNASPTNPSAWYFTDTTWSGKFYWIQNALNLGHGFLSINQEPVSFANVTNNQVQWVLANYLLVKNNASFVYICGEQQYGYSFLRPEYAAQIGYPVDALYQNQGIYLRYFTNGVAIVNPSSSNTYRLQLAGAGYRDLYGNALGFQVSIPAHSGLVLIGS